MSINKSRSTATGETHRSREEPATVSVTICSGGTSKSPGALRNIVAVSGANKPGTKEH